MAKPIRVAVTRATDAWPKGTELGFASEADATLALGDGAYKVVAHTDGSPVEPQAKSKDAPATAKAAAADRDAG